MSRKVYSFLTAMICMAIVITSCTFTADVPNEVYTNTNELADTIETLQPRVIELDNMPIKTQPNAYTCGITTVTVMSNYFNNTDYEVNDLIKKYKAGKGCSYNDMRKWLQGELPGRIIVQESNGSNEEMIENIHASLQNNNPVVIFFGSPNPYNEPFYDFHGSVVYGMNLEDETIIIANSYGYREETSLVDFLNRMSYTEIDKYPSAQQNQIRKNRQGKNTYFLIK